MNRYWRSVEERDRRIEQLEIDDGRNEPNRRDFLKAAGFTLAGLSAACQRPPVGQAIPYLTAPEEIVPGRAYWMASTCHGCAARCGVLVKCRDGRPIKIEGNPGHPLSRGGLCATGQAGVLELYDSHRLGGPQMVDTISGAAAPSWADVDVFVAQKLASAKKVRVVSSTLGSPAAARAIEGFLSRFEDGRHVVYDVPSSSAIADAHAATHGMRAIPRHRFDRADVIVSFDADFLGTWISPVQFTKEWTARKPGSWHVQLESRMSLTGSKADQRVRIHPDEIGEMLSQLAGSPQGAVHTRIHERLATAKGRSLVISGSPRIADQILVNRLNEALGNYGQTVLLDEPSYQREGDDAALAQLIEELPRVDALFVVDCNPVYDLPEGSEIAEKLSGVPLVVTLASHVDETSKRAHVIAPDHHFLESWRDSEPVRGVYAVTQPAIAPLRDTRSMLESFAAWSGTPSAAYDQIKGSFRGDWDQTVHDGYATVTLHDVAPASAGEISARTSPAEAGATSIPPRTTDGFALVLYPSIAMLDGRHAHNAWLHELPDPISKVTWDNYASVSPETGRRLGLKDGDVVRVGDGVEAVELPAYIQPGQHDGVVAIALGYGRMGTERFDRIGPDWILRRTHLAPGEAVGRRVAQLARHDRVAITKTGRHRDLATTQLHNSMEGRNLTGGPSHDTHHATGKASVWPARTKGPQQWGLAVDLERCTGCSGCVIGCQAENNVPVVGKDEVLREREMHWIRIDRYYSGADDDPRVDYQPMMCHHCGNAPCETVCPVLATVHSADGLNQQVYNRCVGTRYCANNCPYKTRRFNWFDYPREDRFANLVLNPDVTVRSRGVMEKCSMCVQRIEEARIEARRLGLPIADGVIQTACQQSCPAGAIVFGNLADPKSRIAKTRMDPRHFRLFEEIGVEPAVGYLRKGDDHV